LLDLQGIDTRLDQLAHRERTLPELAELAELARVSAGLADRLVAAETEAGDIRRELAKADADVDQVRQRAVRDQTRLDAGQGGHKELESLQHELATLGRRQSELEDVELEVMERQEAATAAVAGFRAEEGRLRVRTAEAEAGRDAALAEVAAERASLLSSRSALAEPLEPALLALYEKIRASSGGAGAALLRARSCGGCRLEINPQEVQRIRQAPAEEVVRCEECRRILVRTDESGL
jgi:uncharacterized protein